MKSKLKGLAWVIFACLVGVAFVLGITPLAHLVPWSLEKKIAQHYNSNQLATECKQNPEASQALQELVTKIYPLDAHDADFSIDVKVAKSDEINA